MKEEKNVITKKNIIFIIVILFIISLMTTLILKNISKKDLKASAFITNGQEASLVYENILLGANTNSLHMMQNFDLSFDSNGEIKNLYLIYGYNTSKTKEYYDKTSLKGKILTNKIIKINIGSIEKDEISTVLSNLNDERRKEKVLYYAGHAQSFDTASEGIWTNGEGRLALYNDKVQGFYYSTILIDNNFNQNNSMIVGNERLNLCKSKCQDNKYNLSNTKGVLFYKHFSKTFNNVSNFPTNPEVSRSGDTIAVKTGAVVRIYNLDNYMNKANNFKQIKLNELDILNIQHSDYPNYSKRARQGFSLHGRYIYSLYGTTNHNSYILITDVKTGKTKEVIKLSGYNYGLYNDEKIKSYEVEGIKVRKGKIYYGVRYLNSNGKVTNSIYSIKDPYH